MEIRDLKRLHYVRAAAASGRARQTRVAAELTQGEIAKAVGVAQPTVAQWENGNRTPRGAAALRYAAVLESLERTLAAAAKDAG
ncbi:helix-turn-helix transcriptional regulator [Actinomadura opuntiae]|uniref:helix-turn-helix transcriptional regulator n=1 Tax=Actinomadura sp. OS1-43 TaxID=604315 RepID=UPI00255A9D77|nr:helix-turn-helix transcriptional regulator [Actinomadura sp. OS1-43]MDL4815490.1 helix-turn-helix transcriptional regulator [Actinomadura sp. OS1-43]